jgi:hypothetical protein
MPRTKLDRRHWLGLLFALHFLGNLTVLWIARWNYDGLLLLVAYILSFVQLSQPALLAMWVALARQRPAYRACCAAGILAALSVGPWLLLRFAASRYIWHVPQTYWAYQTASFAFASALFIVIRGVAGWEIVPWEQWDAARSQRRPAKLMLGELLAATGLVSFGLAAARFYEPEYYGAVLVALIEHGWHALIALSLAPFCLGVNRAGTWRLPLILFAATVAVRGIIRVLVAGNFSYYWDSSLLPGFLAAVALSLWIVRLAGFRLLRARDLQEPPAEAGG